MAQFWEFKMLFASKQNLSGGQFFGEISKFSYFNNLQIILKIVKINLKMAGKVDFCIKIKYWLNLKKSGEWMGGCMDKRHKSHFKDCLQQ